MLFIYIVLCNSTLELVDGKIDKENSHKEIFFQFVFFILINKKLWWGTEVNVFLKSVRNNF